MVYGIAGDRPQGPFCGEGGVPRWFAARSDAPKTRSESFCEHTARRRPIVRDLSPAHKGRREFRDRTYAALLHGDLKLGVQDLEHPLDTGLAEGAEPP